MKYVLGLLFNYKHYRNNARLRIFAGEHFVDEIVLDKDIGNSIKRGGRESNEEQCLEWNRTHPAMYNELQENKEADYLKNALQIKDELNDSEKTIFEKKIKKRKRRLKNKSQQKGIVKPAPVDMCYIYRHPQKLFLFEIKENFLHNDIRIECVNDNNNYSNGFMTKFSYIKFKAIFLLPLHLLQSKNVLNTFRRLWKNGLSGSNNDGDLQEFGYFYEQNNWPIAMAGITASGKGKIRNIYHGVIGGSFEINIPLIKKHRTIICGKKDRAYGRILFNPEIIDIIMNFNLLNIYNENQRSNS